MKPALSIFLFLIAGVSSASQTHKDTTGSPSYVVFRGDTLFSLSARIGPFGPDERARSIIERLEAIYGQGLNPDSISIREAQGLTEITLGAQVIMAVTDEDALIAGKPRDVLALERKNRIQDGLAVISQVYGTRNILSKAGITLLGLLIVVVLFWATRKAFPAAYSKLEAWEGTLFRSVRFRSYEIVSAGGITAFLIVLLKGIRLAVSLAILYFYITYSLSLFPWTKGWNVQPILMGIFLSILTTTAALVAFKAVQKFFAGLKSKIGGWKGTLIKPLKLKTVEILSEERITEILEGVFNVWRLLAFVALAYFYFTTLFSFFTFTQTWAGILVGYVTTPLGNVLVSFVKYLPNLFFVIVIVYVTRVVVKFIKLIFGEIQGGVIQLARFHADWAEPTYKIVRFLIFAFAAIMIYPYLPGSDSAAFQGVSVFLGLLFSLGSSSAISNVVAGVVLTYMRPFKIGDRVKIADTTGDVVEKTLLVTRVRTIKNVDISIPNAMVLGSHIINFSSSAKDRGLILHTSVTIGYDAPWKTVHELLLAAAQATGNISKDPKPFVLQTSLDDFYVSYELNAYTDKPNMMAVIYSELHQNIQDRFNEAGVEIMSPHYSAVRDGNQSTIPEKYLPKSYQAPAFRLFPLGDIFKKPDDNK